MVTRTDFGQVLPTGRLSRTTEKLRYSRVPLILPVLHTNNRSRVGQLGVGAAFRSHRSTLLHRVPCILCHCLGSVLPGSQDARPFAPPHSSLDCLSLPLPIDTHIVPLPRQQL